MASLASALAGGEMVFEELKEYPRAFKVLVASALIENTAFGLIIPFLTIYMVDGIGLVEFLAGIVLMGYTISGIPAMIFGGMLADKIGRRTVLLSSLGLMSLTMLLYFFAVDFWTFFVIALADSFVGSMYMPAANAMIADVIPSPNRPKAFSMLRIAWNVGIVFGPVLGAMIVAALPLKWLFVFGSAILMGAFCMNFVFIPETKPEDTGEEATFRKVFALTRDRPFFLISALSGVFWFFFSQWMSVLPLYATRDLEIKEYLFGLVFAVSALMTVMLQISVTERAVNYPRSAVLMSGQLIASAGFALIFFAWDFASLLACVMIITAGELLYMSIISAVIADLAPEDKRGIYMGFSGFVQTLGSGIGFFFGMTLLGLIPDQHEWVWPIFGGIGAVTSLGYVVFRRMIGPEKDRPHSLGKRKSEAPPVH
ncbi:MAG: hypothetical protein A3K67_00970 [Euryarchaeota archaeon RBG_16_62_10]|nr:MAG: hypothetical protein A3K67_00970 [Euryarchaeota archaeon RBG_16_62_10]